MQITITVSLVACYLFFKCRIEKKRKKSPWASLFQIPFTHARTHSRTLVSKLSIIKPLKPPHSCSTYRWRVFFEMLFTLHAWRDYSVEGVPGCPRFLRKKKKDKSCTCECGAHSTIPKAWWSGAVMHVQGFHVKTRVILIATVSSHRTGCKVLSCTGSWGK